MDVTRLSLARVLELGVPITWQEAAAIAFEAAAHVRPGAPPTEIPLDAWILTRGGELLVDVTAQVSPPAITDMTRRMLVSCADRAELGEAVDGESLAGFLDAYGDDTPWRRRRVWIAAVALKALVADAEQPRLEPAVSPVVRQFTRQVPRHDPASTRPRGSRPQPPPRPAATGRPAWLGARAVIWTAIAVSATAAGYGAWRATAMSRRPAVTAPSALATVPQTAPPDTPAPLRVNVAVDPAAETPPQTEP